MLDVWRLLQNEPFESMHILLEHLWQTLANISLMPHEKMELIQDGLLQFLIQKAEKVFIALSLTMLEDEEALHEEVEKKQFTATLKAYLLGMDTQSRNQQPKNIAHQTQTIDTIIRSAKCAEFNLA